MMQSFYIFLLAAVLLIHATHATYEMSKECKDNAYKFFDKMNEIELPACVNENGMTYHTKPTNEERFEAKKEFWRSVKEDDEKRNKAKKCMRETAMKVMKETDWKMLPKCMRGKPKE